MQTAVVTQFEIAAMDPDGLRRFYALLFGWRFSGDDAGEGKLVVMTAHCNGIGSIRSADEVESGGLKMIVEVDDVLENVCYAEELGGHIIELPHEITSGGRRLTVASFADPEGNRVGLSSACQKLASTHELSS